MNKRDSSIFCHKIITQKVKPSHMRELSIYHRDHPDNADLCWGYWQPISKTEKKWIPATYEGYDRNGHLFSKECTTIKHNIDKCLEEFYHIQQKYHAHTRYWWGKKVLWRLWENETHLKQELIRAATAWPYLTEIRRTRERSDLIQDELAAAVWMRECKEVF